jgi:hypothetical protein
METATCLNSKRLRTTIGFCASGAEGINISICAAIIISGSVRLNSISKPTNNQLFYFTFGPINQEGFQNLPGLKEHLPAPLKESFFIPI